MADESSTAAIRCWPLCRLPAPVRPQVQPAVTTPSSAANVIVVFARERIMPKG